MKRKLLLLFLFAAFICVTDVFSQSGKISGIVKDSASGQGVPFSTIQIEGTTTGAVADSAGKFIFSAAPGVYTLKIQSFGYRDVILSNVEVTEGEETRVSIDMAEDVGEVQTVVVSARKKSNTESAVVNEIRKSDQVVSGISSEQISKSQDRDAAQAIQRIPGVTLINNQFVMIRGLSERYNTVMINNMISPSTAAERRSFSFDLIPSSLLDRMMVYKSGAADMPGDFAGGLIKIYTKNVPASDGLSGGLIAGYRSNTTFNTFQHTNSSSTDFLGFGSGARQLPSDFPQNMNDVRTEDLDKVSRSVPNTWEVRKNTTLPDLRLNLDWGKRFLIAGKEAGTLASVNYSNTCQSFKAYRARYTAFNEETRSSPKQMEYSDAQYSRNVRTGLVSNWFVELNKRHRIELKNMFNQLGEDETILREGVNYIQRPEDSLRSYSFRYTSRSIYSSQLSGSHRFDAAGKATLNWVAGVAYFNTSTPDLRRVRTYKKMGTDDPYRVIIPPTATTFDAARFFSKLHETTVMNSADLKYKLFSPATDSSGITLNAGYYVERKSRSFSARWMSYKNMSRNNEHVNELSSSPISEMFDEKNMSYEKALFLEEGTNPSDQYQAQNLLLAGYVNASIPLKKFNLVTGTRVEYNRQTLQSATNQGDVSVNRPLTSLLPFFNLSYNVTDKMLVRAAYSKTVNRPEFREMAPFMFYEFLQEADFSGNPNLITANIHNADLRWELYPGAGETFSIGAFYKRFNHPIETYIRPGADNPIFTFGNATSAYNLGAEIEVRKSLDNMSNNKIVRNLSLIFNGSLIKSQVDLGSAATFQNQKRALQGQSPYVVNGGLYYMNENNGMMVSVLYNIYGRRIFAVGDKNNPTVYELPRHSLDLSISRNICRNLDLRLGVQDLLNYRTRMKQDSNEDGRITGVDETVLSFRRGAYFTAGLGFRF